MTKEQLEYLRKPVVISVISDRSLSLEVGDETCVLVQLVSTVFSAS